MAYLQAKEQRETASAKESARALSGEPRAETQTEERR